MHFKKGAKLTQNLTKWRYHEGFELDSPEKL